MIGLNARGLTVSPTTIDASVIVRLWPIFYALPARVIYKGPTAEWVHDHPALPIQLVRKPLRYFGPRVDKSAGWTAQGRFVGTGWEISFTVRHNQVRQAFLHETLDGAAILWLAAAHTTIAS